MKRTGTFCLVRALHLMAPGRIELRERAIPEPEPGGLVIRVQAATTCGTDLKAYRRGHPKIPMPGPFGHEWAGEVAAVGAGGSFGVGDLVMGVHTAPCGTCAWCRRDQGNLCETIMETMVLGSYAEYLSIPARIARIHVFPRPPRLSASKAALLEPLASVAQGYLEMSKLAAGPERALVIGPGAIGLMWAVALRANGWDVVVAGRNPDRLRVAREMGLATTSFADLEGRDNYDLVVEGTGQVSVWERAPDLARRGGIVVLFGGPPGGSRASFDTHRLHYDQIALISPFHLGTPAVRLSREWLLGDVGAHLDPLLSGERALEEATDVFADLEAGRGIKWVFVPTR